METGAYISISLQLFGALISFMIIIFLRFVKKQGNKLDRLYIRFLFCNTIMLVTNAITWVIDGRSGGFYRELSLIITFFVYVFQYIWGISGIDYFLAFIENRGGRCKVVGTVVRWMMVIGIVLIFLSQYNDMYYLIDMNNVYQRQPMFWLYTAFPIVAILIILMTLIYFHNLLKTKEIVAFSAYLVLPAIALILQTMFYGVILVYLATTLSCVCIYIFIQAEQTHELYEKELELEKSRTAIVLSQIQPHFLYNSLLGIKQLCDTEPHKASDALEHFSYYLRENLYSLSDHRLIPFDKEIDHVKNYLYLEKMRFEERINIIWELNYIDFFLPPMSVQSIVENAIRHGLAKKEDSGTVIITSKKVKDTILITVFDDGIGFDISVPFEKGRPHVGIQNVRKRIEIECNGKMNLKSEVGKGTEITISIPQKS